MTNIPPPTVTLPPFSRLAPRISLFTPQDYAAGELIILCTWLGAARKHIAKYVASYRSTAPGARILLVESAVSILVSSYAAQHEAIKPAVQAVRAVLEEGAQLGHAPTILLHTFSGGGTNSATQMLLVLEEQLKRPLPLVGIICDSGPAKGGYWKSYNAMTLSLPKGSARVLGLVACHVILVLLFASVAAGRYDQPEDLWRRTLLDAGLVAPRQGMMDEPKPRRICYIFSQADQMVDWHDIVDHAKAAREKGWEVDEVMFEDTAHCNHFGSQSVVYREKIDRMWKTESQHAVEPRSKL